MNVSLSDQIEAQHSDSLKGRMSVSPFSQVNESQGSLFSGTGTFSASVNCSTQVVSFISKLLLGLRLSSLSARAQKGGLSVNKINPV